MSDRVTLLGAAGTIGQHLARQLVADGVTDLVLVDVRQDEVRSLAQSLGLRSASVDVTDIVATSRLLRDSWLAVNATLYYQNISVMEACLQANCSYLDLGGLYHTTHRQLDWHPIFERAGLRAVLGMGKAPGITNLLASYGAERFDRLSAVHLRSGRRALDQTPGIHLPYSPHTLLDEFTLPPVVLENGKLHEVPPMSGRETVVHPEPFGPIEYITTLHSELATLPKSLGRDLQSMDFKVGLSRATVDTVEMLVAVGFASTEPIRVGELEVRPRDVTAAVLSKAASDSGRELWITEVELVGERNGKRLHWFLRIGGDENRNGTALGAAAAVDMWRKGNVPAPGVLAPEVALEARPFLERLASYGLTRSEEERVSSLNE